MKQSVRKLTNEEIREALPLVRQMFNEYEAANYPPGGAQAFFGAIRDEGFLSRLSALGAFDGEELIGILASRSEGAHVALFFVDGRYHRQGVGRMLWNAFLDDTDKEEITVNSSQYAVEIYEKLGFVRTDELQIVSGIRFVPMMYKRQSDGIGIFADDKTAVQ